MGQITAAQCGTILGGRMTCLEVPTGGVADIDLYWATEATGKFDDGIAALTETALITAGGNWTLALTKAIADPVGIANGYLYLTGGAAGHGRGHVHRRQVPPHPVGVLTVNPAPQPPQPVGEIRLVLLSTGEVQVQARVPGSVLDVALVLGTAQMAVLNQAKAAAQPKPVIEVAGPGLANRLNGTH
jgi:hypothetical protein